MSEIRAFCVLLRSEKTTERKKGLKQLDEFLANERLVRAQHDQHWSAVDKRQRWDYIVTHLRICVECEVEYATSKQKTPNNTLARSFYQLIRTADSKGPTLKCIIEKQRGLFNHIFRGSEKGYSDTADPILETEGIG